MTIIHDVHAVDRAVYGACTLLSWLLVTMVKGFLIGRSKNALLKLFYCFSFTNEILSFLFYTSWSFNKSNHTSTLHAVDLNYWWPLSRGKVLCCLFISLCDIPCLCVIAACRCDYFGSTGECQDGDGQCLCRAGFAGAYCSRSVLMPNGILLHVNYSRSRWSFANIPGSLMLCCWALLWYLQVCAGLLCLPWLPAM